MKLFVSPPHPTPQKPAVTECAGTYLHKHSGIHWIGILADKVSVYFFWDISWNVCTLCNELFEIVQISGWLAWQNTDLDQVPNTLALQSVVNLV